MSTMAELESKNRDELEAKRKELQEKAHKRFDIKEILRQWEENVFSG